MNISKIVAISLIISMSFNSASFAMNIHQAAEVGDLGRIQQLLQSGVDVDAWDINQDTPLHRAAEKGHEAIAKLLLQNNAAVDARDEFQFTPLHRAALRGHEAIAKLLLANRAAVDAQDALGFTPLHMAVRRDHAGIVRLLLQYGAAAVDARSRSQRAPLHWAVFYGHAAIAQLLEDWPIYETYMRRQGLLRDGQTIARARAQASTTIQAFVMATHQRLGAQSPARVLDRALLQFISSLATSYSLEEIHQIAERERRNL